jgi:hypothetical protein
MSAKLSTTPPDAPPAKPEENKIDRFRPEMPEIPGVGSGAASAGNGSSGPGTERLVQIGSIAVVVLLVTALAFWFIKSRAHKTADSAAGVDATQQEDSAAPPPSPIAAVHEGPSEAATVEELSKPWAAKKFTFVNPVTQDNVPAMVLRLPGGGLWAFSLQAPFGKCELEFVTDLATLASKYRFRASHPMVVNPCDGTVFDPLKVTPLGGDTWARGQIVQGSSLRPPISIDVQVRGKSVIADGIE